MNKKSDKPNIILLIGDCLRAENVSKKTMPFLKDNKKIEFKACYSPSTWTLPSYASLYTMSSPIEHNVTRPGDKLKKEFAILPFILKESNYETSAFSENPFFGKMSGFDYGIDFFDENIGYKKYPTSISISDFGSIGNLMKNFPSILKRPNAKENLANIFFGWIKYIKDQSDFKSLETPHNSKRVLEHIKLYLERKNSVNPKAVFTNFLNAHSPYLPSDTGGRMLGLSFSKEEKEAFSKFGALNYLLTDQKPPTTKHGKIIFDSWASFFNRQVDVYNSQIRFFDELLKEWWSKLSKEILNNSLIIVTGDHGQLFGEENMYGHHTSLHPHGIHVPLFIFPPNDWNQSKKEISKPVSLIGLSKALSEVAKGNIQNTEDFIEAIEKESDWGNGEVIVTADGPTWKTEVLKKNYDPKKVQELEVRKIALIKESEMHVYSCPWNESELIHREYKIKNGDRFLKKEDTESDRLDQRSMNWLLKNKKKEKIKRIIYNLKKNGKI